MKIAVLSGKGGTGKTFVSVNLAAAAKKAVYVDCDVEEPNGKLFLKPENVIFSPVSVALPEFDASKCTGCRKCVDFCRFNALIYIKAKGKPTVFPEVCHACGGCFVVCPAGAVKDIQRPVGKIEYGSHNGIPVITGVLATGEVSAVPVIKAALSKGISLGGDMVIDCPPGSGCPVIESVLAADVCVIVAEPTAFGLHNFKMAAELSRLLQKPCCVVINKESAPYQPLDRFCRENGLPILLRIPYSPMLASMGAGAKTAAEEDDRWRDVFASLWEDISREAAK